MDPEIKLTTDLDFCEAWQQVVTSYKNEFGDQIVQDLTIDQVIEHINPHKDVSDTVTSKVRKFTKAVLVCVQQFGNIVATATSAVFSPSQQCFNAVNFVILATQKTTSYFDDIATLMERLQVFLQRLTLYLDQEDSKLQLRPELRQSVYQVLTHFMDVMKITHHATKQHKIIVFGRHLLFGDDTKIKKALATLETRVADVTGDQVAAIGKDLQGTARDVRDLKADTSLLLEYSRETTDMLRELKLAEQQRQHKELKEIQLSHIYSKIGVIEHKDLHNRKSVDRLDGTGTWLFDREDFRAWSDPSKPSSPLFAVQGDEARGRSFLAHAAIEHIQARQLVVYCYLSRYLDCVKRGTTAFAEAVRAIVMQLIQHDHYRRAIHAACDGPVNYGKAESIFQHLILDIEHPKPLFIMLENVGQAFQYREAGRIAKLMLVDRPNLRHWMSGRLDGLKMLPQSHPYISLEPDETGCIANEQDILLYIDNRLDRAKRMRESQYYGKRGELRQALLSKCKNDFIALTEAIQEIIQCKDEKDMLLLCTRLEYTSDPVST